MAESVTPRSGWDLHTHSFISDGTDAPADVVAAAQRAGLAGVALTDHDTFEGLAEAEAAAERLGVGFLPGLEMSCQHNGISVHLLGYGCDPEDAVLGEELARIRDGRDGRLPAVLAKLADLGMELTAEEVRQHAGVAPSLGRPHIADAMVARGYVANRTEAFDRYLRDHGPAHVPRYAPPVEEGIGLVRGAGGVAVIAHPWGRGRRSNLPPVYLSELARDHGLDGIEVDHQDHDRHTRAELRALARDLGLLATGSSDFHGTGKVDHDVGVNTTDASVVEEIRRRLGRADAGIG